MRGIAIFAVVLGHTLRNATMVYPWLYCFHVPMCVYISGLVFSRRQICFSQFLKKKITSLMVPYYCFAILSILLYAILGNYMEKSIGGGYNLTLKDSICGMLYANAGSGLMRWNMPLWYIPMMFVLLIAAYFIYARNMSTKYGMLIFAVSIILGVLCYSIINLDGLPFGCETAIYLFPFFALGMVVKHFIPKIENAHWYIRILTGAILIVLGTVLSPANGQISYNADYYGNNGYMYFVLTAICLITGFTLCVSVFRNGVACIDYVGRNTMPIMLMHKFPILFFVGVLGMTKRLVNSFPLCGSIIVAICSVGLSCVAAEIIYRILPWMLGKEGRLR